MKTSLDGPPAVIPSFVAKVARAKKHLIELEAEITAYKDLGPCTVRQRVKGKGQAWCLEFIADPANTDIPIIVADTVHNLRTSLDHLMSSLVPRQRRRSVMFPIMWPGVWEAGLPGENKQRVDDRVRWQTSVKGLSHAAIAILQSLQPPESGAQGNRVDLLALVNWLSNRDKHEKLPVVALGVRELRVQWTNPDGTPMYGTGQISPTEMFEDDAEIAAIPRGAVDVQVQGIPVVALKIGQQKGYVEIPKQIRAALRVIEERIIPSLMPYVRP